MVVLRWPSVALTGASQAIPAVCPNCMGPAAVRYRYPYVNPFSVLGGTSYYQSFGYCERCEPLMEAWLRWQSRGFWRFLLYVAAFVGGAAASEWLLRPGGPLYHQPVPLATGLLQLLVVLAPIVLVWLLIRAWKKAITSKHPLQEGQLVLGPAAYYTGQAFGGFGSRSVYRALRPEWLAALVRANPGSVDAGTYARVTGEAAPAKDERKPFA